MSRLTPKLDDVPDVEILDDKIRIDARITKWDAREAPEEYKPLIPLRFEEDVAEHLAANLVDTTATKTKVRVFAQLLTMRSTVDAVIGCPDSRHLLNGQGPVRFVYGIFRKSTNAPADTEAEDYDESDEDVVGVFEYAFSETHLAIMKGNGATITRPGTFEGDTWPFPDQEEV